MSLQRGTVQEPPAIDLIGPPATFEEMWVETPLVVYGRVEDTGEPVLGPADMVVRVHRVRVFEVLKASDAIANGTLLSVEQLGGTVDVGGREVRTAYPVPLLEQDEEAVLFLKRGGGERYLIWFGRAGLFRVHQADNLVNVPQAVQGMSRFRGRPTVPLQDLLRELRQMASAKL